MIWGSLNLSKRSFEAELTVKTSSTRFVNWPGICGSTQASDLKHLS